MCLLLHAVCERDIGGRRGADIEDQVRREPDDIFEIDRVAAPSEPAQFRQGGITLRQERPRLDVDFPGPSQHLLGCDRIEGDRGRRPGRKDPPHLVRDLDPAAGGVGKGLCVNTPRRPCQRGERAGTEAEEAASPHLPTITSDALMTANASSPTLRARSSTASLVIDEVTMTPPPISMRTCAVV